MGPNELLLRKAYAAYVVGEPLPDVFSNDIVWTSVGAPNRIETAGEWHGLDGVAQYFEALSANWALTQFVVEEVVSRNDSRFALRIRVTAESSSTGKSVRVEKTDLVTMKEGKIVEYAEIYDTGLLVRAQRL